MILPDEDSKPGPFYMNIKKHKPPLYPGRLISTTCGSPIENLSAFTAYELNTCVEALEYRLKDTNNFILQLDDINANPDSYNIDHANVIHATWDVIDMFNSIPQDMALEQCREHLNKRIAPAISTECIAEAIDITLKNNVCMFCNTCYRQEEGVAMGPHNACHVCDAAMNKINKRVMSSEAPYKPSIWTVFRDDCYDAWMHGEEALHEFTEWLNTLHPTIKFKLEQYSKDGVEYLDTFVFSKDNKFCTKVHCKPSDTHAYLMPVSCHPLHTIRNIPSGIALRVRKLSSEQSDYSKSKEDFSLYLRQRGFHDSIIDESFKKAEEYDTNIDVIKNPRSRKTISSESTQSCTPLVVEYNPRFPNISSVVNKYKYILDEDPLTNKTIPSNSVFVSFKRTKNFKDLLTHSRYKGNDTVDPPNQPIQDGSCKKCDGCALCRDFLLEAATFKSFHKDKVYSIRDEITCTTNGIIYMISDLLCNKNCVGSTLKNMRTRWSNYKSHIKQNVRNCEVATHFNDVDEHHCMIDTSNQGTYTANLKSSINVIIIEKVDFKDAKTKSQKLSILASREGYWQTELRSLKRFGGLNVRDERKISNTSRPK